jgi:mRNA interferase RelE/StbE
MTYEIEIKSSAQKELTKLPRSIANKVIQNIRELANDPRPSGCKKLVGTEYAYRIRINNYRVVYSIFDQQLVIQVIKIAHRKEVYK